MELYGAFCTKTKSKEVFPARMKTSYSIFSVEEQVKNTVLISLNLVTC